jgi:hypothetical protein
MPVQHYTVYTFGGQANYTLPNFLRGEYMKARVFKCTSAFMAILGCLKPIYKSIIHAPDKINVWV